MSKNEGKTQHSDGDIFALTPSAHECGEPSSPDVHPDGVTCGRCGAQAPSGMDACPACHCFLPGTQAARKTGIYAQRQPPNLQATVDAMIAGIISDHGGDDALATEGDAGIRMSGRKISSVGSATSFGGL